LLARMTDNKMKDMASDPKKLINKHQELTHSEMRVVVSHVQRAAGDWVVNTLMIDGCDVPFKYKRKQDYKNLKGQRVNLTYYPAVEVIAGMRMDVMNVVRIKRA